MADKSYVAWRRDKVLAVVASNPFSTHNQVVDELKGDTVRHLYDYAYNDLQWLLKNGYIEKHRVSGQVVYAIPPIQRAARATEIALLDAMVEL